MRVSDGIWPVFQKSSCSLRQGSACSVHVRERVGEVFLRKIQRDGKGEQGWVRKPFVGQRTRDRLGAPGRGKQVCDGEAQRPGRCDNRPECLTELEQSKGRGAPFPPSGPARSQGPLVLLSCQSAFCPQPSQALNDHSCPGESFLRR